MGGIEIPVSFTDHGASIARHAIDDTFIFGFRWAMGITAFLAFMSGVVSFMTIPSQKS